MVSVADFQLQQQWILSSCYTLTTNDSAYSLRTLISRASHCSGRDSDFRKRRLSCSILFLKHRFLEEKGPD
ncbi:hypothetical protein XNW1_3850021 [Xenorhabdus nematophila str. Websteri]|nr:hypothetical protein XNW1_3850021 [Xenorhabdus nematophila str. Websteri]